MNRVAEMPAATAPAHRFPVLESFASFLLWAVVFGIAYTQAPLFFSNQNQYFLHGLAHAGYGNLANDWLANTLDPTPLFSALVAFTHGYLHDWFFYGYYVLVLGVYLVSLAGIAEQVAGARPRPLFRLGFIALFVLIHSALLRWASVQAFGVDYPWYFQAGVAGQYILGPVFQPSVFGVLLIVSIYLFLQDRPLLAGTAAALSAILHATYLLHAGFLVAAYLYVLGRDRRFRDATATGALALALVLPVVLYNAVVFGPTSAEQFAQSQDILARFRIRHHTDVKLWCDSIALAQVGWIFLGLWLVRGQRLFLVLAISLTGALSLTLLQLATDSTSLALLFPWRASIFLVPLATTTVLAKLLARLEPRSERFRAAVGGSAIVLLAALMVSGGLISYLKVGYRTSPEEELVMKYVRDHKAAGDCYLVPFDIPDPKQARPGAASGDFKPPRSEKEGIRRIAFGPQRFRLCTGVPIFVDVKSIPYKDIEVIEWRRRLDENDRIYTAMSSPASSPERDFLAFQGITHVITRADQTVVWPELVKIYEDRYFRIYRVQVNGNTSENRR